MLRSARGIAAKTIARISAQLIRGPVFRRLAPQSNPAGPGDPLRIAIVDLIPSLGDAVMMFPLLDALQRDQPRAMIDLFGTGAGQTMSLHPVVHQFFHHGKTRPWANWIGNAGDVLDMLRDWYRHWRSLRYHVCFVPRGGADPLQSAHLAWMLGGRRRLGYSRALEPERKAFDTEENVLFTDLVTTRGEAHEVSRGAEVLALANLLKAPVSLRTVSPSLVAIASGLEGSAFLRAHPQLEQSYAIIAPGASAARRRWTAESFAELAELEMVQRGWLVVLVGSPGESEMCEQIAARLTGPSLILTGTSFAELAAICMGAKIFVGNDSGPGHVAGAVGTPTLEATAFASSGDPFHHASPNRSHPCGPFVRVEQPERQLSPCSTECVADEPHCIRQVGVDQMRHAFRALIASDSVASA